MFCETKSGNFLDSLEITSAVESYISGLDFEYRVTDVFLYADSTKFDRGEPLCQNWKEVNKSCLCGICFSDMGDVNGYIFYDKNGEKCYGGALWKPCK